MYLPTQLEAWLMTALTARKQKWICMPENQKHELKAAKMLRGAQGNESQYVILY